MKRRLSVITLIMILAVVFLPFTTYADGERFIHDNAGLLKSDQEKILKTNCGWLAEGNIDFIISTDKTDIQSAADEADSIYRQNSISASGASYYTNGDKSAIVLYGSLKTTLAGDICEKINNTASELRKNIGYFESCQYVYKVIEKAASGKVDIEPKDFYMPSFLDEAGFLTAEQAAEVTKLLDSLREKYKVDVAIITEKSMIRNDAQLQADDLYDYNLYGYGENDNGILFYVCDNPRQYAFTTAGKIIGDINGKALKYIEERAVPKLSNNDYYGAFKEYISSCDNLLQMAADGKPYNKKSTSTVFIIIVCTLLIPLIFALIRTKSKKAKMITAVKNDRAADYMKEGSLELKNSNDIYMYSTVTKTPKPKSTSSGTHTSSSGRSHGGRSGSY